MDSEKMRASAKRRENKSRYRSWVGRCLAVGAALLFLGAARPAAAGTVSGVVQNGTTNHPVSGADVILLALQGGMQAVATVKTDASGHFTITNDGLGAAPMLLRVPYKGVFYHAPVPPNTPSVQVEVYEPTRDPHSFTVTTRAIILQPKGSDLTVGEEYTIENQTQPPVAFYLKDGSFRFELPQGAQLSQVSAWDASKMPVIQGTIDKGSGVEAVDWPFRPGDNGVRISYELPYTSNQATIQSTSIYDVQSVILAVPPGLQVSAAGFSPAQSEQGFDIYTHAAVAANTPLAISVSGIASAPAASPDNGAQDPSVNSRADGADAAATTALPPRLDDNVKYILVAGFAALFLLGVIFLWRRPAAQTVGATTSSANEIVAPPAQIAPPSVTPAVEKVEREATRSLDELKETLFRLELRHQAGTISEQDYTRERERTQKILRDLLKG
ncbi:MAG: carboxypeptidase-like regulatory domain-containing protein [Candidatus Acidiferrales bacterium]